MPQDFKAKFRSAITFFEIPSFYQLSNHHIISQMCTCDVSKVKPEDVTRQFLGHCKSNPPLFSLALDVQA